MNIISQHENWFSSAEGQQYFAKIQRRDDQIGFMYSYLLAICKNNSIKYEKQILFNYAFFLSDAVLTSGLSYSKLPDYLDCEKNPYLAFIKNSSEFDDEKKIYTYLLLINHNVVNPFEKGEWIYNKLSIIECADKVIELKHNVLPTQLPDVKVELFEVEKEKEFIQLEIIWLFGKSFI